MADKTSVLRAFNAYFSEFLDYVVAAFPEDAALRGAKKSVDLIRGASPAMMIRMWKNRICGPYAAELASGDIDAFVANPMHGASAANEGAAVIVEAIRAAVAHMDAGGKADVVLFMQNLSKLAELYYIGSQ